MRCAGFFTEKESLSNPACATTWLYQQLPPPNPERGAVNFAAAVWIVCIIRWVRLKQHLSARAWRAVCEDAA